VLFGTLNIFLYPQLYPHLGLDAAQFGLYAGATVHEVAQVVAVGSAISPETADAAVVVKLTRVLMLVPVLLVLGWREARNGGQRAMVIPWFALGFLGVVALNSVVTVPAAMRSALLTLDTLLLATAMAALGIGAGEEVIMPTFTFVASFEAVLSVGAIPVLVDVDDTLTLAPAAVKAAITPATKAATRCLSGSKRLMKNYGCGSATIYQRSISSSLVPLRPVKTCSTSAKRLPLKKTRWIFPSS
jgi:hypothetical protein